MDNEIQDDAITLQEKKFDVAFVELRKKYGNLLDIFLNQDAISEVSLNDAYKFGRQAVVDKFTMLSVTAIHHDALIAYLQNLEQGSHLVTANKASLFLEEVLAPFSMVTKEFRESIYLINKQSVQYAIRLKSLQHEISHRQHVENDLRASEERYRHLAEQLQASLKEKEALLKEIYHRVKNNLQVISSLLNLQMENIADKASKKVMIESVTRVKSMALVHEMLYQSSNLAQIGMVDYIHKLFEYLCDIYEQHCGPDNFVFKVENISLGVDVAIPIGLILNELMSNCFKHAFIDREFGTVTVSLIREENKIILKVSDNGIGFPKDIKISELTSLGMRLIVNLTKQLSGKIEVIREQGTTFVITIG